MNEPNRLPPPGAPPPYEPPAIVWEEELPQGPGLFLACNKIGGTSSDCNSVPGS